MPWVQGVDMSIGIAGTHNTRVRTITSLTYHRTGFHNIRFRNLKLPTNISYYEVLYHGRLSFTDQYQNHVYQVIFLCLHFPVSQVTRLPGLDNTSYIQHLN